MTRILLIGGTDSSGGAGLSRDVTVAGEFGCLAKPVVTCVTAQTDTAVQTIHEVPATVITTQIRAALAENPPHAIKIGMIGSPAAARAIADAITGCNLPIVMDPVLKATSGGDLGDVDTLARIIRIADLLTPNLEEAATLSNRPLAGGIGDISVQAGLLRRLGARAVLIKGGHGRGDECRDHLFDDVGHRQFCLPRLAKGKRGTGCTLATAVACGIAQGADLHEACRRAKQHIQSWIADQGGAVHDGAVPQR